MKIVADEYLPHLEYYFGSLGEIIKKNGRVITQADLQDATILLCRSVTVINEQLLKNTSVRFIGSAVSGVDHIDISYLEKKGILWADAGGCNSDAVAEYIFCAIAALQQEKILKNSPRIGIIGVGRIGSKVWEKAKQLNLDCVLYDPIRALHDKEFVSASFEELVDLDLITIHAPLTYEGPYPTFHMLNKYFFERQKQGCVLINTARGAIIQSNDLKENGQHLHWCLDVWENEPHIDPDLLNKALIATPHIAGYSVQSKERAVAFIYEKMIQLGIVTQPRSILPFTKKNINIQKDTWQTTYLALFNPLAYTHEFKRKMQTNFDLLRNSFNQRYEFQYIDWNLLKL